MLKIGAYKDIKETGHDHDVDYEITVAIKDDDGKIVVKPTIAIKYKFLKKKNTIGKGGSSCYGSASSK